MHADCEYLTQCTSSTYNGCSSQQDKTYSLCRQTFLREIKKYTDHFQVVERQLSLLWMKHEDTCYTTAHSKHSTAHCKTLWEEHQLQPRHNLYRYYTYCTVYM